MYPQDFAGCRRTINHAQSARLRCSLRVKLWERTQIKKKSVDRSEAIRAGPCQLCQDGLACPCGPTIHNTQYAIRNTQYAIRNTQYAIRSSPQNETTYLLCNTQYAIRNTQLPPKWDVQYTILNTQYTTAPKMKRRNTQIAIRNTQYAIRSAPLNETTYLLCNTQYAIRNTQLPPKWGV